MDFVKNNAVVKSLANSTILKLKAFGFETCNRKALYA